jgi:hypothetical protein
MLFSFFRFLQKPFRVCTVIRKGIDAVLWIHGFSKSPVFTQVFLARNFKLRYNEGAEGSCQSESEVRICTETLTGTR